MACSKSDHIDYLRELFRDWLVGILRIPCIKSNWEGRPWCVYIGKAISVSSRLSKMY